MLYFRRKEVKMSLIKDYVFLMCVKNFCNNLFASYEINNQTIKSLNKQNNLLFETYTKIFEKLKMNDLSLLILRKETKDNNCLYLKEKHNNFQTTHETIKLLQTKQNRLTTELPNKLEILRLKLI